MGNEVFANGMEVSCKAGDAKVVAAFPDVCLSPPSPPAGPIPVPYPDTSFSKDMKNGSKTVKIDGQEVMLKDQSFFKTSPLGDEAATKTLGAGVVTHVITGTTYYVAWSMDVQIEGLNVDRHLDLTTSNHASQPGNESLPFPGMESMAVAPQPQPALCECCNAAPPHSAAQARGEAMTEDQFYGPAQTGPRRGTGRGGVDVWRPRALTPGEQARVANAQLCRDLTRDICPDQVPPNPPGNDPCNRYYLTDPGEAQEARRLFDELNNPTNPLRPAAWANAIMVAHRVPLVGGGCPIGPNAQPVNNQECADWDGELGTAQGQMAEILRPGPGFPGVP